MSAVRPLWINQSVRFIGSHVGEFIHLCAIYLGIAVLVTVAAGIVVPSIRAQANVIYDVVTDALRPKLESNDHYAVLGWFGRPVDQASSPLLGDEPGEAALLPPSAYTDFAQVLQQTSAGLKISGLSRTQLQALRSYISRKYKIAPLITGSLIQMAYANGREKDIDPLLILAVIAIESSYNPFVESHAGAQGLMQVMTRVHKDKLDIYSEGDLAVFSPEANLRAGTQILYDCKKRRGSIQGALSCYVGATGPSDGGYGAKVLAERSRIALASGIAVKD